MKALKFAIPALVTLACVGLWADRFVALAQEPPKVPVLTQEQKQSVVIAIQQVTILSLQLDRARAEAQQLVGTICGPGFTLNTQQMACEATKEK